jgi:predicted DNA-binding transcriptional regulator YafY
MLEVQTKVKRQLELLGMAIGNAERLKDVDFALILKRDIPTIKRDMQELRGLGVQIHSEKAKGLCLGENMDPKLLRELILQYLGICTSARGIDKATTLLVKKHKDGALQRVVLLQRCIESNRVAKIDYQKDDDSVEKGREIWPLLIFSSEGQWRVLALNDGRIKQYLLTKLLDVMEMEKHFKKVPQEQIDDMFTYSFRSWIGTDRFKVKIHLNEVWAKRIRPRQMMETEIITEERDGSVVFETTVNSLEEMASWVVSRGGGVKVLEPLRLKDMVLSLANAALANY